MKLSYDLFQINTGVSEYNNTNYQYWIFLNGTGHISSDTETYLLTSHDIFEIPFNKNFRVECGETIQIGRITLTDFESRNNKFQFKGHINTEMIRKIFFFALDFQGLHHPYMERMQHHIDQLMYDALMYSGLEEYKINPHLADALAELNAHAFDPDYNILDAIKVSGYSQSYFHKIFLEETGTTPIGFIQLQRIHHAKYLLEQENHKPISQIAHECAFKDPYYFSRIFKKITGLSPSEYAKANHR